MQAKKPHILVVGSFVMDQIVTTDIFPREGQTVLAKTFRKAPGGKGANQAVQMARLGAEVTLCGKLGRDANGQEMLQVCREAGIHTEHVCFHEKAASGCSVIILEETGKAVENRIMVIPGANMTFLPQDIQFLKEQISDYDLLLLQLEIPMEINVLAAKYAHDKGVPVMLNPAPSAELPDELLACLTYISPNEHEAEDLTGIHISHTGSDFDRSAARAAAEVLRKKGVENVLITLGSAGAVLLDSHQFYFSPAVPNVHAADPTAAGDSFVGAFSVAVCSGKSPREALAFANRAAAKTVTKMGAMPSLPWRSELGEEEI